MSGSNPADWAREFQALAQKYWQSWGDFAQQAGGAPAGLSPGQGWQEAIDWWSKLAHGGREEANTALDHFNQQMRQGYGLMQELAGRFAGKSGSASEIVKAWRQAIGANGAHPFPELFKGFHGQGLKGIEQLLADASPFLGSAREQIIQTLKQPAFGFAREHQERWQRLMQAQMDYQEEVSRYNALLAKAGENAFGRFESLLAEREEPGRQLASARALFDLWIDAAEDAYAEIALSEEFRKVYGDMVNAQMRLRGAVQLEVEHSARALGTPTRSEVQASHAKVHALERELLRLRKRLDAVEQSAARSAGAAPVDARAEGAAPTAEPTPRAKPESKPEGTPAARTTARTEARAKKRRVAAPTADVVVPAPAPGWWGNRADRDPAAPRKTRRKAAAAKTKTKTKPAAKAARALSARAEPTKAARTTKAGGTTKSTSATPARPAKAAKSTKAASSRKPAQLTKAKSGVPTGKPGKASRAAEPLSASKATKATKATKAAKRAKPAKSARRRS